MNGIDIHSIKSLSRPTLHTTEDSDGLGQAFYPKHLKWSRSSLPLFMRSYNKEWENLRVFHCPIDWTTYPYTVFHCLTMT